jgi:hypothetical protein
MKMGDEGKNRQAIVGGKIDTWNLRSRTWGRYEVQETILAAVLVDFDRLSDTPL